MSNGVNKVLYLSCCLTTCIMDTNFKSILDLVKAFPDEQRVHRPSNYFKMGW